MCTVDHSSSPIGRAFRAPNTNLLGRILIAYAAVGIAAYAVSARLIPADEWHGFNVFGLHTPFTTIIIFVATLISGADPVTLASAPWLGLPLFAVQQLLLVRGGLALIRRRGRVMLCLFPYFVLRVVLLGITWVMALFFWFCADLLVLFGAILPSFVVPTFLLVWLTRPSVAREMRSW